MSTSLEIWARWVGDAWLLPIGGMVAGVGLCVYASATMRGFDAWDDRVMAAMLAVIGACILALDFANFRDDERADEDAADSVD